MGASIETTEGHLPLRIEGRELAGIDYLLPVASAQVKSAILLAGLYAEGRRRSSSPPRPVTTPSGCCRRPVRASQCTRRAPRSVADRLSLGEVEVPGDFSSAAPFVVAATLVPGSELHIHGVNLNPRRTGLLVILERMGASVNVYNRRPIGGEPGATWRFTRRRSSGRRWARRRCRSRSTSCLSSPSPRRAPVARACFAAPRLRAKETDRIEATVDALRAMGVRARGTEDGFVVTGVPARIRGGRLSSRGDHRLAMLGAVAGLASREGVRIDDAHAVGVSFPAFFEMLDQLRRTSAVVEDDRR